MNLLGPISKKRVRYFIIVVLVMNLGLASRVFSGALVPSLAIHEGDALWAMMVYYGCRFLFVQKSHFFTAVLSLIFSFCIEFSQLYQADWITVIRGTTLGALILGKGFLAADLARYSTGILLAFAIDWSCSKK
ncbi:MAG: DUF2809 domain-containing protein [Bacillus sp. (in: firmicutes)]